MAARIQVGGTELDVTDEEELLLILAGMGTFHEAPDGAPPEYLIGEECKDCISDLQRYLRRDDPMKLAATRAVGSWRVLQNHLIPLLRVTADSDSKLCFEVLKVVVKLTLKPEDLGYKMVNHLKEKKQPDPSIGAYLDELRRYHRAYKSAFVRSDAMGSVVRLLARPLSVREDERSEQDSLSIELLFALLLNLLYTAHPDEPPPEPSRAADVQTRTEVLRSLLVAMEREHALELALYVLQQVEEPGALAYRALNLTLLEIVYYVLSAHTPTALYAAGAALLERPGATRGVVANGAAAEAAAAAEAGSSSEQLRNVTLETLDESETSLDASRTPPAAQQQQQHVGTSVSSAPRTYTCAFNATVEERFNAWSTSMYSSNSFLHEIGATARQEQRDRIREALEVEWRAAGLTIFDAPRANKSPVPAAGAAGGASSSAAAARTSSGSRKAMSRPGGALAQMLASQRAENAALQSARPSRHANFGGAYRVQTVFGTVHTVDSLNGHGEPNLQQAAKRRPSKAKMPMAAPMTFRADAQSERVVRDVVDTLLRGPFNALMSTVVKDLEGSVFGSNAFNAGKVIIQDHTFFAAVASWVLQAHLQQQQQMRDADPSRKLEVGPVGALADASVFSIALRNCRELLEKKAWLPLGVVVSLLRQLFGFLDAMVRHGDAQTQAAATTIRRNIFYEGQVLELLRGLIENYEPHRMPPSYMADCAVMTHAVLRQLRGYGNGALVLRKKKKKAKRKKKASAAMPGEEGDDVALGLPEPDEGDEEDEAEIMMQEAALDFEHELYKFAGQREVVSRYVSLLSHFETVPADAIRSALSLIEQLVKKCKLEAMLFQLSTLTTFLKILESPAARAPQHADLLATCRYVTRRFFTVAERNPAVFVEALVWKKAHECEDIVNAYQERKAKKVPAYLQPQPSGDGLEAFGGGGEEDPDYVYGREEVEGGATGMETEGMPAAPRYADSEPPSSPEPELPPSDDDDDDDKAPPKLSGRPAQAPPSRAAEILSKATKGASVGDHRGANEKKRRVSAPKKPAWTSEEDATLRERYAALGAMDGWHHIMAGFLAPRSALEVLRRATKLGLTGSAAGRSASVTAGGSEDEENEDEMEERAPHARKGGAPKAAAARDVEPPSSPEPELPPSDDEAEYEDEVIGLEDDEARPPPPVASARGLKRPAAAAAIVSPENADPHSSAAWQSAKSPAPAPMHKRRNVVNDSDDDD